MNVDELKILPIERIIARHTDDVGRLSEVEISEMTQDWSDVRFVILAHHIVNMGLTQTAGYFRVLRPHLFI